MRKRRVSSIKKSERSGSSVKNVKKDFSWSVVILIKPLFAFKNFIDFKKNLNFGAKIFGLFYYENLLFSVLRKVSVPPNKIDLFFLYFTILIYAVILPFFYWDQLDLKSVTKTRKIFESNDFCGKNFFFTFRNFCGKNLRLPFATKICSKVYKRSIEN